VSFAAERCDYSTSAVAE